MSWIRAQCKRGNVRLFMLALFTGLVSFAHMKRIYIGRDTYSINFVNFLYFSDSLKSGIVPFWNHYILSGSNFVDFNNVGLFSPFQLVFVFLSWLINPLDAFELMLEFVIIVGGVGSYLLCRKFDVEKLIALFGATAFTVAVLVPTVGQSAFLVSLASFPWLIYACIKIIMLRQVRILHCVFFAVLWMFFAAYGYLWMNLINLFIAGMFSVWTISSAYMREAAYIESRLRPNILPAVVNLLLFLGGIFLICACLAFPGYASMAFYYDLFTGDYLRPDPSLRGIAPLKSFSYSSLFKALIDAIDPIISVGNSGRLFSDFSPKVLGSGLVSFGAGMIACLVFFMAPWRRRIRQQAFWLLLMVFALMYSAGQSNFVGNWIQNIPIVNANRWWFVGIFYVSIALICIVVIRIPLFKEIPVNSKFFMVKVLFVASAMCGLLIWSHSPSQRFFLLLYSSILIWLLGFIKKINQWNNILSALIVLNVIVFLPILHAEFLAGVSLLDDSGQKHSQEIEQRIQPIPITMNDRRLGNSHIFIISDDQWLLKKKPISHGRNNLGNPLYWYIKNELFLNKLVNVTQDIRKEKNISREHYVSDNAYAEALVGDVLINSGRSTIESSQYHKLLLRSDFKWKLLNLMIEPNAASMQVTTNSAAYLVFNNAYFPGWQVYVNGKQQPMVKTNRLFQGVFLDGAGTYNVLFKFRPIVTIWLLLVPYIVLFLCLIGFLI